MRSIRKTIALAGAALLALLLSAPAAHAQDAGEQADCQFIEISASNGDEPQMDKGLQPLAKKLKRGPFRSRNVFKMLARHNKTLSLLRAEQLKLAVGKMSVLYREHSKPAGKKERVSLDLAVDDKKGKRVLDTKVSFDTGDYVLVGQSLPDDTDHVVAVSCRVK